MEHKGDGDAYCNKRTRYRHLRTSTGTGGLENKRKSGDHPNYSIVEISQNTEESPKDLLSL